MTDRVERVARAIIDSRGCGKMQDGKLTFCDECDCEAVVRAAIEAMREPTDAMIVAMAGREIYSAEYLATRKAGWLADDWRRAIDAALKPSDGPK